MKAIKTLEELGVSPMPWKLNTKWKTDGRVDHLLVNDGEDEEVAKTWYAPNAQLVAAAPDLYAALREAVEQNRCWRVDCDDGCNNKHCWIRDALKALRKAAERRPRNDRQH